MFLCEEKSSGFFSTCLGLFIYAFKCICFFPLEILVYGFLSSNESIYCIKRNYFRNVLLSFRVLFLISGLGLSSSSRLFLAGL